MNNLIDVLEAKGLTFLGIARKKKVWKVYAHNPKLAGPEPVLEYCRDAIDYSLSHAQWEKMGTIVLFEDKDYNTAIQGAINVVKGS